MRGSIVHAGKDIVQAHGTIVRAGMVGELPGAARQTARVMIVLMVALQGVEMMSMRIGQTIRGQVVRGREASRLTMHGATIIVSQALTTVHEKGIVVHGKEGSARGRPRHRIVHVTVLTVYIMVVLYLEQAAQPVVLGRIPLMPVKAAV